MTASAPKRLQAWLRIVVPLAILLVGSALLAWHRNNSCQLRAGKTCYQIEYARSADELARGLGGRNSMGEQQGMLFVLPANDPGCFWMKDMRFNLDIIWLNQQRQITQIKPNLSPATYPQVFCKHGSAYVLELQAGQVSKSDLLVGQVVQF